MSPQENHAHTAMHKAWGAVAEALRLARIAMPEQTILALAEAEAAMTRAVVAWETWDDKRDGQ